MSQPTDEMFFDELKEWSERKLKLLRNYLEGAVRIMQIMGPVYYVDCFAGRGTYGRPGEPSVPGSPLQAAMLAQSYIDAGKTYSLHCVNVESDSEKFQALQIATATYGRVVLNLAGTFASNVNRILAEIRFYPTIAFIDPFGVDGMDWAAVQRLIRRQGKTDLWIRFDVKAVHRRAGWYKRQQDPAWRAHFDVLMRAYGATDADQLYTALTNRPDPEARRQAALSMYMDLLRNEFQRTKREAYAYAYRIGTLEQETKYYLIFASANKKGGVLACDVVHNIEEDYQRAVEQSKRWLQISMFDPTPDEILEAKVTGVREALWPAYRGKTVSRLTMRADLLDKWFGSMKGTHMTKALQSLLKDGYITSADGQISNDDTMFTFRS